MAAVLDDAMLQALLDLAGAAELVLAALSTNSGATNWDQLNRSQSEQEEQVARKIQPLPLTDRQVTQELRQPLERG